jgi:hypothetical protein
MAIPPQFRKKAKMTEARDAALDKKRGIKEGSKADTAMDRKFGLPSDKKKVGAGHAANKRNPKGSGPFPR